MLSACAASGVTESNPNTAFKCDEENYENMTENIPQGAAPRVQGART